MKPTRKTQPYRAGKPRPQGKTLKAMQKGRAANRPHPLEAKRKLRKNRRSIQAAIRSSRSR